MTELSIDVTRSVPHQRRHGVLAKGNSRGVLAETKITTSGFVGICQHKNLVPIGILKGYVVKIFRRGL
jgi:hypothetical protein